MSGQCGCSLVAVARQYPCLKAKRNTLCVAVFRWALGLAAFFAGVVLPVHAEMSGDDYRSPAVLSSPQERARVAEELAVEQQRMALEAEQRQKAQAIATELQRWREQQRPLGERLLEAKCTSCHSLGIVKSQNKSGPGWRWTVERMRWWHGVSLEKGEAGVIAQHMAQTHGAASPAIWLLAGAGVAGVGIFLGVRRMRGRRVAVEPEFQTKDSE